MNHCLRPLLFMGLLLLTSQATGQWTDRSTEGKKPKLVVGVIIDQMRAEYLYRFKDNYSENGFKRLMEEGFNAKNTHYNYVPTATCLGHASVFTGTTPSNHGIVSNLWYSRGLRRNLYCVEDSTVHLVNASGVNRAKENREFSRSPKNIKTTTITDELKLFTNGRSKVIGLSLKDRSAISPAGHLADAAYWYNTGTGDFISSSFYMETLPAWLLAFNDSKKADSLLNLDWEPILPIGQYTNSMEDNAEFEKIFKGRQESTFPYKLGELRRTNGEYALLPETPYGNSLLTKLVKATLEGEHMGQGDETDFLTISYSSTDYVGHAFGIRSKELEDTYLRMDREIAELLRILDRLLGQGNYLLFLTADHGASEQPQFLEEHRLPGGSFSTKALRNDLENRLSKRFGPAEYVAFLDNTQIYFSADLPVPKKEIVKEAVAFLKNFRGIKEVYAPEIEEWPLLNGSIGAMIRNSFNTKESGDIIYHMESGWMVARKYGTTHGTAYSGDTHVPMLWFGWGIRQGFSVKPYRITQIAPTLSFLLDIPLASASDKEPIQELFE